ncbi:hypothetical protein NDN08_000970 [Rhodosorus marinus]|uniref:MARVEL domain-containing protein n=1 Tax=Rhodosorus marinus TaxID=101924 RepID=A0AAV8UTJ6_9RHOD|nr:hypothetical protein NDN08_000970 [Rhodosorus marinus]
MSKYKQLRGSEAARNPYLIDERYPYEHFYSGEPRSGTLTPYSLKLLAHLIILVGSVVVWGDVSNFALTVETCSELCAAIVPFALVLSGVALGFLLLNLMIRLGYMSRLGPVTHFREFLFICLLYTPFTVIVVAIASDPGAAISNTGLAMAWMCFFFAFYAALKAFHVFKEQDQPSSEGDHYGMLDEDNFIYG